MPHFVNYPFPCHAHSQNIGMPRILLCAAHTTPLILNSLGVEFTPPSLVEHYPNLPAPYEITKKRIDTLLKVDAKEKLENSLKNAKESAKKEFCNTSRCQPKFP